MRKSLILLFALTCLAASPTTQPAQKSSAVVPTGRLEQTLYWLADDAREGRGLDSPGLTAAANYIAERFRNLRLRGLDGWDDYFQPFVMKVPKDGKTVTVRTQNVAAMLPGGAKADEYIVVGAHYDHLGRGYFGRTIGGAKNEIRNGADDNASGTTVVLELAENLVRHGRLDRSIIFVLFSGEEEGLYGSRAFVDNPPVPLNKIVAMVNLDMVGRLRNNNLLVGGVGTCEAFLPILKKLDEKSPLELSYVGRGGLGPSDHASFGRKHIPIIFFFTGLHIDYHRPTDDAEKINYAGLATIVEFTQQMVEAFAVMPKQQYVRQYDGEPALLSMADPSIQPTTRPVRLGVTPDYGSDDSTVGVPIVGVMEGSPAERAGFQVGDILVQAGDMQLKTLYDLSALLSHAKPGDKTKITVLRSGVAVDLDVIFDANVQK